MDPDAEFIGTSNVYGTGFLRSGRWAILPSDVASAPGHEEHGLTLALEELADRRLQPAFIAVADPERYRRRGLWTAHIVDEGLIDLTGFDLSGKAKSNIRRSVNVAGRAGLRVVPWSDELAAEVRHVSDTWLATKRGGELRFNGRFDPVALASSDDVRIALDRDDRVMGFMSWNRFGAGRGRIGDLVRRLPDSPSQTIDLLFVDSLLKFAAEGVEVASISIGMRSEAANMPFAARKCDELVGRMLRTRSNRRYKSKFGPRWEPRYLALPARFAVPGALRAVLRVSADGGLWTLLRTNKSCRPHG